MVTPAEASRAIYIDFEALQTKPHSTPELLGVLDAEGGHQFQQLIVDHALAPARVANHRCHVVNLRVAVEGLLERAESEDRLIIGWSLFDRDVAVRALPDSSMRLVARYRNALQTARPWLRAIHPEVIITRAGEFDARHTLKKYVAIAGYPGVPAFAGAAPARWLRHMLAQLESNSGRYRRVTSEAKRDWHKVLDYNHHDCLALRHLVVKAAAELASWRSFQRTTFCVEDDGRTICFMAGSRSRRLDAVLERHAARPWAFMTSWNPAPRTLTKAENDSRQHRLRRDLDARRLRYLEGLGVAQDRSWEEESLLILGISRAFAIALARKYGQLAIVVGERGGRSELLPCAPPPRRG
ncbi:MAG: DUF3293 domain-containing protein [Vicinamibacterales bacterium]